ncbi:hypothetical protein [Treponema sp.]|uniref:hypothetical protein n=1 Tax=Treponema sp. TaxID=166 RepID=UPI003FA31BE5
MTFDKRIIAALRECKSEQQIKEAFNRFRITDIAEKQRYLTYAMYAPSYFFSPSTPPTDEQLYEFTVFHFITGYWRLTPFYEKLGLVKKPLSEADNRMLKKLNTCTSQQDIDAVFDEEGIHGYNERCNILRRCMRVQGILGDAGISSEKDDYAFDCAVFLEGSWRDV